MPSISRRSAVACLVAAMFASLGLSATLLAEQRVPATAFRIPAETTSEESGYFSIIEGLNERLYIGTSKYGSNAYLVEFNPEDGAMKIVVDAHKELGYTASGFAAQAKFHTRNNVGASGRIYTASKQGYTKEGETRDMYPGGYSFVYDPETGKTTVYGIPIKHHGIISITPDESRNLAYISTCDDGRPIENSHFMVLDLETGEYRDLMNTEHMYAFIVVDHLGRAYHPIRGGDIARYNPDTDTLDRLTQTIDGQPPKPESHLADPNSHPINWDITPDGKTLYAVAMSANQLIRYDLTTQGHTLKGETVGPLIPGATRTDCRAMAVGPTGIVWAAVSNLSSGRSLRLVRYDPERDKAPVDLGEITVENPGYTDFKNASGGNKAWHHGMRTLDDGRMTPLYPMGVCQARDGHVYALSIYPYTLLRMDVSDR